MCLNILVNKSTNNLINFLESATWPYRFCVTYPSPDRTPQHKVQPPSLISYLKYLVHMSPPSMLVHSLMFIPCILTPQIYDIDLSFRSITRTQRHYHQKQVSVYSTKAEHLATGNNKSNRKKIKGLKNVHFTR